MDFRDYPLRSRRFQASATSEAHIDAASRRVVEKAGFIETGSVIDVSWTGAHLTRVHYVNRVATT
jgi:hypothetical protein